MPRQNLRGVHLPIIKIGPFTIENGDLDLLAKGKDENFVTSISFVLPIKDEETVKGSYYCNNPNGKVDINIYQKENESDDLIFSLGKQLIFGASIQFQDLPFSIFTDNRGIYPCFYINMVFHFRLEDWKPITKDEADNAIFTGIYSKDKNLALKILNGLFSSEFYPTKVCPLQYEDITNFIEIYYPKGHPENPIYQLLTVMDSRNAFEEAIIDYLGDDLWQHVSRLANAKKDREINNETDLFELVNEVINDVIKHHIENRRWIAPFWNDERKDESEGKSIILPKQPKKEPYIQPTLNFLLFFILKEFGVHVERETDEGVGSLDFKCLFTTKERLPICIPIEFKLAHNENITHGLSVQLPAYLEANRSNHGIFLVMWFKDEQEKVFNKPEGQTKQEMIQNLQQLAEIVQRTKGFVIRIEMIDASVKPSASNL